MKKKLYIQPQSEVAPIFSSEGILVTPSNLGGNTPGGGSIGDGGDDGGEDDYPDPTSNNSVIWDH